MKYEQIAELLHGISERFDWEKVMEGEYIIGLKQVMLLATFSLHLQLLIFKSSFYTNEECYFHTRTGKTKHITGAWGSI